MLSTDAGRSKSVTRDSSKPDIKLPSLVSLYNISTMEQRLKSVIPLISKANYSLINGKALLKLRVSVVLTGCDSELSMASLNKMRSTFTTMVEWYLQGKTSMVMFTTSHEHMSKFINLLLRLREFGWKRWKCMLTLDLSGRKFVVPGIDPDSSPNFVQSLVKERLHLPNFSFYDRRYYAAVTKHMSSGHRAMTPDEVHCLKTSRLAFHVLRSCNHETLSLPTLKSDVDMCALTSNLLFYFIRCKAKDSAPVHIRREEMLSSLKTLNPFSITTNSFSPSPPIPSPSPLSPSPSPFSSSCSKPSSTSTKHLSTSHTSPSSHPSTGQPPPSTCSPPCIPPQNQQSSEEKK